jgi:glycosyltransferase involved in cell wall biosynthesis
MAGRMSVLHVAQPTDGGVARYLVAACLDQAARGWDVTVACPDGGRLAADLERVGIARLHWAARRAPGPGCAAEAARLGRLIAGCRPRVVHLHASKAGLAGRLALRRRLPTVFQPHGWSWLAVDGPVGAASLAWERAAARWTDLTVCVGEGEARHGRARGVGGRYTVVRNGTDLSRFHPADAAARTGARRRLGVELEAPLAVCVGRVTRQKGQDVLVSAWPLVRRRCPRARLALVGDGNLLPALKTRPVAGVSYVGALDDVRPWLAAADIVVAPSRWEGLSLAVLEALATGRSVVASDVPGLAEAVAPGTGVLVPPDDPVALADAVRRRLADPALAAIEGVAAARHAAGFDLRSTFDVLAEHTAAVAGVAPVVGVAARTGVEVGR